MATFYWVGGSGTWDNASNTHWAATSGGAGGAGVPTNTDDVIFDSASNGSSYTLTLASTATCRNVTWGAPATGSITTAGGVSITIAGSILSSAGLNNVSFNIAFTATTGGQTITSSGKTFGSWTFNGSGGVWALQDTANIANFTLTTGAFNSNGQTFTCGSCNCSGSLTRTLILGASLFTVTNSSGGSFLANFAGSNFSLQADTSTVVLRLISGGQASVTFGANTFNNLTFNNASGYSNIVVSGGAITVSGNLVFSGLDASAQRIYIGIGSGSAIISQTQVTFVCNGTVSITNTDFEGIVGSGSANWSLGTSVGNCGFNSGITFTTPVTARWRTDSGNLSDPMKWSTGLMPLPQDLALFDASSFTTPGRVVTNSLNTTPGFRMPSMDFTGILNTPDFANTNALIIYGTLKFVATMTYSGAGALIVSGRSGSSDVSTAGLTITGPFGIATAGATCSLQDPLTVSAVINYYAGTFNTNDYAVTCTAFLYAQTSVDRTGNLGASLLTLTGSGTVWQCTFGSPFHVLNAGTSTIKITDSSASIKTFSSGTKTYNNIWFTGTGTGSLDITGSNTFNDFKVDTPPHTIRFTAGTTTTVTTFTVSGTPGNLMTIGSITAANHNLVKAGGGVISRDYLSISRSQATPNTAWYAGTHSLDNGNNSGWRFKDPPTLNIGGQAMIIG